MKPSAELDREIASVDSTHYPSATTLKTFVAYVMLKPPTKTVRGT
jgi:hypothetical protein